MATADRRKSSPKEGRIWLEFGKPVYGSQIPPFSASQSQNGCKTTISPELLQHSKAKRGVAGTYVAPGDWVCDRCNSRNSASISMCHKCLRDREKLISPGGPPLLNRISPEALITDGEMKEKVSNTEKRLTKIEENQLKLITMIDKLSDALNNLLETIKMKPNADETCDVCYMEHACWCPNGGHS